MSCRLSFVSATTIVLLFVAVCRVDAQSGTVPPASLRGMFLGLANGT